MAKDDIVTVDLGDGIRLPGELQRSAGAAGFIILACSHVPAAPALNEISRTLHGMRFHTLVLGLLTVDETRGTEGPGSLQHHLGILARRLRAAARWVREELGQIRPPLGCLAMRTMAAATLLAAAQEPSLLQAVVCSEGRPDLAGLALRAVASPTLLIVPEHDRTILDLNRDAYDHLKCAKHLEIVYDVTQLLDAPAALTRIEHAAAAWFGWYLQPRNAGSPP